MSFRTIVMLMVVTTLFAFPASAARAGPAPVVAAPTATCTGAEPAPVYQGEEPWPQRYLAPESTWQAGRGGGVTVALLSSGADAGHVQLTGSVERGLDVLTGAAGADGDCDGRGTRAAGVILARPSEGTPVHGLAPDARLLPVRVVQRVADPDGSRASDVGGGPRELAAGITWAALQGARVICVTVTTDRDDPTLRAAVRAATEAGALVVSGGPLPEDPGSGQEEEPAPRYPSAYPDVLAVGAVGRDGALLTTSERGDHLDVTAPAAGVVTTSATGGRGGPGHTPPQDDPALATAAVAGTAALVLGRHPDLDPAGLSERIVGTALPAPRSVATAGASSAAPTPPAAGAPAAPPVASPQAAVWGHVIATSAPLGVAPMVPAPDASGLDGPERRSLAWVAALLLLGIVLSTTLAVRRSRPPGRAHPSH